VILHALVRWLIPLGVAVAIAASFVALVWAFQRRLIYLPTARLSDAAAAAFVPDREEVELRTADGLRLGAWFVEARRSPSRAAILVCNGNAGNRSLRAPLAAALAARGFSVLLFDYRGYGGNPGRPSEAGLIEDARAARAYLASRGDVDARRIVYFGESLGAAVAVALADERPPAALVLRSPFTSLADVGRLHYPFLPVRALLADRFPSVERIGRIEAPLLVLAGERDGIVPAWQSRALFQAAPEGRKRLWILDGADHNDLELLAGQRMIVEIERFLAAWLDPEDRR
jgi:fermentation-respiration switch protein FrsA (DUF1100 family)